jgi:hypothetical protein
MELRLVRKWLTKTSTIGELTVDGKPQCFVLEDHYPTPYVKTPARTAIPAGRYEVRVTYSPRFKCDMPLLIGVPGYEGVRIHPGNTADDTEGCLLPGKFRAADKVTMSRVAYSELLPKIQAAQKTGQKIFITIEVAR